MLRRSVGLAVLACAAVLAGCDRPRPVEPNLLPQPPREFKEFYLFPADGTLFTIGSPDNLQLVVVALDDWGRGMDWTRSIIFASSALTVAEVDGRGMVTAVAPGIAEITASLTIGGITRSASMTVSVVEPLVEPLPVSGTYDLDAVILGAAWTPGLEGYRYTGVFTFPGPSSAVGPVGTFAGLHFVTSAGVAIGQPSGGTIRLEFWSGRPLLHLFTDDGRRVLELSVLTIAENSESHAGSPSLKGDWYSGELSGVSGTYTATRWVQ